jgi:drug/metabolite transporter (DMT)-like permease
MLAVVLALAASAFWGTADYTAGVMVRRTSLWAVILVTQLVGLAATGVVLIAHWEAVPPAPGLLAGAAAGLTGLLAVVSFYKALSIGVMSLVAPVSATGIIVPVLVGLALGERPSTIQYVGMVTAVGGVLLASQDPGNGVAAAGSRRPGPLSLILAVTAAVAIGLSYVAMDRAAEYDVFWGVFLMRATSTPLVVATALAMRPRLHLDRHRLPPIVFVGLADVAANTLFSAASTLGYLSVVAVLGYLYPVVTVLLAHLLLRERLRPVQRIAALAALAGAVMVAA